MKNTAQQGVGAHYNVNQLWGNKEQEGSVSRTICEIERSTMLELVPSEIRLLGRLIKRWIDGVNEDIKTLENPTTEDLKQLTWKKILLKSFGPLGLIARKVSKEQYVLIKSSV